jgi:hypothetical protein
VPELLPNAQRRAARDLSWWLTLNFQHQRRKSNMSTKLTVKRADLIKAIKAKAAANKKEVEKAAAEAGPEDALIVAFDKVLNAQCSTESTLPRAGVGSYNKSGIRTNFQAYVLTPFGITRKTPTTEPKLFERELAILEMATDETLSIDDNSDYFSFLKP